MKQCNQETLDWYSQQQQWEEKLLEEERITLLEALMRYLPPLRQKAMTLYYLQGIPIKRIAALLRLPQGRVCFEMHQALDFLQKVTRALECPAPVKAAQPAGSTTIAVPALIQQSVFQLRHTQKLSFEHIADKMNHSAVFIHQCYVNEHARLHQLRQTG
ncbi:hypothetical protein HNQ91_002100 [Filimonas zeae]|uniref:RNA polymerase sigma factor 70 region 4 type 2 domain-containing protein n=1 Tax=Filimonas zeae TaxID=1737353 RepID=A0A917IV11_9BACT|nr:sigma-70 family RNA polymerase sigma factor [Filimonas zeae]MDR6339049.1 hypothetical protein [Filimonas zeae]GGH65346.1 hypothetical protein GCM10011379_18380 [Filimonas zeae]